MRNLLECIVRVKDMFVVRLTREKCFAHSLECIDVSMQVFLPFAAAI
jgi:hypothetical protein